MKKLLTIGMVFVIVLTVALAVIVAGCGEEVADDATDTTIATEVTEAPADGDTDATEAPAEDVTTTVAQ